MQRGVLGHRRQRAVERALLQRRQHVGERHRDRRATHALDQLQLERRRQHADLQAGEVGQMRDLLLGDDRRRSDRINAGADQALVAAEPQHQAGHRRILDGALVLLAALEQAGRAERFVALVDADQEFGRPGPALDRAKLHALDLPRNGAELARRIDSGLDAAAGVLLHGRGKAFEPFVLGVVHRRGGELHRDRRRVLRGGR